MCVECMREETDAQTTGATERQATKPINAADESIKMIELECRIASQRKTVIGEDDKENLSFLNTHRRPLVDANKDLRDLLKKSSSDLQRHASQRRKSREKSANTGKRKLRDSSAGRWQRAMSTTKVNSRKHHSGRPSQTDFVERNRLSLSNLKLASRQRVFRL